MDTAPLEVLQSMEGNIYQDEDGFTYSIELLPGMSRREIAKVATGMPHGRLPDEIIDLLTYSRGFNGSAVDDLLFADYRISVYDLFFPRQITLGGDGRGNSWIVDIDTKGNWGPVYFMDHDPPVIVKFADNLAGFLHVLHENCEHPEKSTFQNLYGPTTARIYKQKRQPVAENLHNYDLSSVENLPNSYRIESLVGKSPGTGFRWAPNHLKGFIYRLGDQPVWVIEMNEIKERMGLLERLLNLFR